MDRYYIADDMNRLLLALSRGPVADPPWEEFLQLLGQALGADFVTMILRPPRPSDAGLAIHSVVLNPSEKLSPSIIATYKADFYRLDPFIDQPPGKVVTIEQLTASDNDYESESYRQQLVQTGIRHLMGVNLSDDLGNSTRLRFARLANHGNFAAEERALCQILLPHMQQTIRLQARIARLESERTLFATAVDRIAVAAFILDRNGRIRQSNTAAERLLRDRTWLTVADGRLRLRSHQDQNALRSCLDEVMQAHLNGELSIIRALRLEDNQEPGVGMLLRPLPLSAAPEGSRTPSVAVFISDPSQHIEAPVDLLATLFDFTPAEAKLCLLLLNGASLDEACEKLTISRNTGKTHLRVIFSKTGVSRQAELIQLLLRSVVQLGS